MDELSLRYFWILSAIGCGILVRTFFRWKSDGKPLADFVTTALLMLSFMPASITSAAVCAGKGEFGPIKWVAASIFLFLLYCPFLIGDSFSVPVLSYLDFADGGIQSPVHE